MYAYTQNNPVMYTDSTGYLICGGLCIAGIIVGVGLIAGALEIGNQHTQYRNNGSQGEFSIDWGSVAIESTYAMATTALIIFGAGSASYGLNWYFYSRMGLTATYSIGRGFYDDNDPWQILGSTVLNLSLTAAFTLVGNRPMAFNLIDWVGESPIGTFAMLTGFQIIRHTGRIIGSNFDVVKQNLGIENSNESNYYQFD